RDALATVEDPEIHRPITDLDMVESVAIDRTGAVRLGILLTVAGCPLRDKLRADITAAVASVPGVTGVAVDFGVMTEEQRPQEASCVEVTSVGAFARGIAAGVWRGPMLHRPLPRYLAVVYWGGLDHLLLDLPLRTGDIAISPAELLPGAEILLVSTLRAAAP